MLTSLETEDGSHVAIVSLKDGETRILIDGSSPVYLPSGHLVYASGGSLFAVPFDTNSYEIIGTPVPVLDGIYSVLWGGRSVAAYSVSDTGTLAYSRGGEARRHISRLVRVDRTGQVVSTITAQTNDYAYPRVSPDGERIAVSMQTEDGRSIWMVDTARGSATRFTFENSQWTFCWSSSGDRLTYQSTGGIAWRPVESSAGEERLVGDAFWPGTWSPDDNVLAYTKPNPKSKGDIWLISRQGNARSIPYAESEFNEVGPAFSPDGHSMAYVSDESGRNEVYIQPYPGPGEKKLVSTDGGEEPVWSRDGTELFYRDGDKLLVVSIGTDIGTPETLFEKPYHRTRTDVVGSPNYDVSADGQSFVMIAADDDESPGEIDLVLNWTEELNRLVPTSN